MRLALAQILARSLRGRTFAEPDCYTAPCTALLSLFHIQFVTNSTITIIRYPRIKPEIKHGILIAEPAVLSYENLGIRNLEK